MLLTMIQVTYYKIVMIINFSNVESLIFNNDDIKHLLPPYYWSFFEQWKLGKQFPMLKQIGKSAILDFINHLNSDDIKKIEDYFGEKVIVEKLNYHTVVNVKIPLTDEEICQKLCEVVNFNYFSIWRDIEYLYITFWR